MIFILKTLFIAVVVLVCYLIAVEYSMKKLSDWTSEYIKMINGDYSDDEDEE